ncbi:MAG: 30S ribosomal protein S4 [Holosporaceae bacterium]|jgi:small subunit ribosomal protein S4|nr:30S ribosomal protein S4 [Holosporaceae bacterium]
MSKRIASKYKIDRRLGVNLWGRQKSPINNRNYGPGQHGNNKKKPTDYGVQLQAKQKLRGYYGNISERQFRNIYQKASRMRGDTSQNIIGLLERRLDSVVYRMRFAATVFAARQLVSHGHVLVNAKSVDIASYLVQEGDVVEIRGKSKANLAILQAIQLNERDVPSYMNVDFNALKGTFVHVPKFEDVPYPVLMEPNVVVEFYSR